MRRNEWGFPVEMSVGEMNYLMQNTLTPKAVRRAKLLSAAQKQAAEVRARNFPPECACPECVRTRQLPAVQRILAKWQLK